MIYCFFIVYLNVVNEKEIGIIFDLYNLDMW